MSWYKQSLRLTSPVEYAQQTMEDNREDIEYLVTVLSRHKELAQDLELITDMVGYEGESAEDAEDVMAVKNEMAQLKKVWNNYSETLRNFALYLSSNEEL